MIELGKTEDRERAFLLLLQLFDFHIFKLLRRGAIVSFPASVGDIPIIRESRKFNIEAC